MTDETKTTPPEGATTTGKPSEPASKAKASTQAKAASKTSAGARTKAAAKAKTQTKDAPQPPAPAPQPQAPAAPAEERQTYVTVCNVRHRGHRYKPKQPIELTQDEADELRAAQAIT